jgi:5-methylthioadenosine/S-adenosylhomocysteine deaminase
LYDHYAGDALIRTAFAPHAPYTVSDEPFSRIKILSDELNIPIHMHIHETNDEINGSIEQFGVRPLERLERLGLLSPNLVAVHMTHLDQQEIDLISRNGVHVVHCPESNLKLASGFCPVTQLIDQDINVALGTDSVASNNDLNMIGEMRTAALLAKARENRANAVPAFTALKMATINGARAFGMDEEIGSLEKGKAADITAINLNQIETQPVYDPVSQIVYAATREQVSHVWINGQHVLNNRRLTTLDEDVLLQQARKWHLKISES